VDRAGWRTEFVAIGNWRVIGQDTARLLARHGAHLVHSAPSVGVRDWSDLRIAVSAGVWLASARPGDVIEIVSDDRAFDAVGDVAAGLGITFRRLSYRGLTGAAPREEEAVKRSGALTLADGDEPPPDRVERPPDPVEDLSVGPGNEAPRGVGEAASTRAGSAEAGQGRRRRSRRGGRRHRGRGAGAPSPAP